MKTKKGQFAIFSAFFLFLLLFFIYSLETVNTYKFTNGDFVHIQSSDQKICDVLSSRNGTELNSSIITLNTSLNQYCLYNALDCRFDIYNITPVPPSGNWSLLNISQFEINYYSNTSWLESNTTFRCT